MQVKAKEVHEWHPINGLSYITRGAIYPVVETYSTGVFVITDDTQHRRVIALDNCAHGVVWEVVDAS